MSLRLPHITMSISFTKYALLSLHIGPRSSSSRLDTQQASTNSTGIEIAVGGLGIYKV
jgi:hypothetical protein